MIFETDLPLYSRIRMKSENYISSGVYPGMIGDIIERLGKDKYEVEFYDQDTGETISILVLDIGELIPNLESDKRYIIG